MTTPDETPTARGLVDTFRRSAADLFSAEAVRLEAVAAEAVVEEAEARLGGDTVYAASIELRRAIAAAGAQVAQALADRFATTIRETR